MNTWCGSPVYAAPEIMLRDEYEGPKADIWSLGIILYAFVTGCMPWSVEGGTKIKNMQSFLEGKFRFPAAAVLSSNVKDLISSMLRVDPNERISVRDIIVHPWMRVDASMSMQTAM